MLNWSKQFNIFCFINNCSFGQEQGFRNLVAAGASQQFNIERCENFCDTDKIFKTNDWLFGHISFEAGRKKSPLQKLPSDSFNDVSFFVPSILFELTDDEIIFLKCNVDPAETIRQIENSPAEFEISEKVSIIINNEILPEEYFSAIGKLKQHLQQGDCYEMNYCQAFFGSAVIQPEQLYFKLSRLSPYPFSAFYKNGDSYCLCQSPERFFKKENNKIISQPIKGTIKRQLTEEEDKINIQKLKSSKKDRAENVMIVDLVRNDLSVICEAGTVKVDNLFEIKSFPSVHQMVSTISGELMEGISAGEIFNALFPMGSMTGAPKTKVIELTEKYERSQRGIFSGTIGYLTPEKNMDFNVVIRSLIYNGKNKSFSFRAGGGITINSDAAEEFEESLLKTQILRKVLL